MKNIPIFVLTFLLITFFSFQISAQQSQEPSPKLTSKQKKAINEIQSQYLWCIENVASRSDQRATIKELTQCWENRNKLLSLVLQPEQYALFLKKEPKPSFILNTK